MTSVPEGEDEHARLLEAIPRHMRPDGTVNLTSLAREFGLHRSNMKPRVVALSASGALGTNPVLPGFMIRQTTAQYRGGELVGESIKQVPEGDITETVPKGFAIKGFSTLRDAHGRTIVEWTKTREEPSSADAIAQAAAAVFEQYRGRSELAPYPAATNSDLLTVYNISDHHLGLLAWGRETGVDYDLHIGEDLLMESMNSLVASAPNAETALILNLGDFFHSDNDQNETERSHNKLDVDGRFGKILQVGIRLLVACVELALQKHRQVIVRCLPGNHDPHLGLVLPAAIACFFHDNPRVTVDCDPDKFFWFTFGKVFIGATHGDRVKPDEMPGVMASMKAKEWGASIFRYAYFGHVHHRSRGGGEKHGIIWETFQTLAAKDQWHHAGGYVSGRSMVAITHHRERGEVMRHTVSVS